jgi:hypothetical protein
MMKRSLLDAKRRGYLKVGSGINVARTLEGLGIAEAVKSIPAGNPVHILSLPQE